MDVNRSWNNKHLIVSIALKFMKAVSEIQISYTE